ncbi:hypothetical protein GYMLUDRAFT_1003696 [Collybiopsis luxurians FD-317 M1]|uniref:Uncharacterized protein n=1 Tax=Collybiopsis luxurians FD-317 M1 TaxID=944289 RepID=A0A0D0CBG8_9AGAR|nr:hypothetical protein GYMLUDRAFT_1003696 [Collybiopsis luxurians FD-317 M1]
MAIVEGDEISQLWAVITELSEQLNQNRSTSVSLYAQTGSVKNQAMDSQTGFVLRRFNANLPKEAYESEIERMNSTMTAENQSLQHDNKQLNTLIKEYEQTLDTLMSTFRNRAQTVQENELSLIRQYESNLLQLEEENSSKELETSTRISESISRLSEMLRNCLREVGGERTSRRALSDHAEVDNGSEVEEDPDLLEREPWQSNNAAHAEWALEREVELARLERENEELRMLIMAGQANPVPTHVAASSWALSMPQSQAQPQEDPHTSSKIGTGADVEMETKNEESSVIHVLPQQQPDDQSDVSEDNFTSVDPYATVRRSRMGD